MPKAAFEGYGIDGKQREYTDRHPVVHHAGSAKRPKCGCGSWINHWFTYTGKVKASCVYMGCSKPAEDGAHVRFVKRKPNTDVFKPYGESFIVPMCGTHNRSRFTNPFFIDKTKWMINDQARDECETTVYRLNAQNYFYMQVLASNGKPKCGCPSHFAHYRNVTGSSRSRCVAMECGKAAVVAAPMRSLDGRTDYEKWIAPLCKKHARKGGEIFVKRKAEVASPAKQKDRCGA